MGVFNVYDTVTTKIVLTIEAHASPRWRNANPLKADRKNLSLSRRRAETVRQVVESKLRSELSGRALKFEYNIDLPTARDVPGLHRMAVDAVGSDRTLKEADGDRTSDEEHQRRVEVTAELSYLVVGDAPSSVPYTVPVDERTKWWAVSIGLSASVHIGVGGSYSSIRLKNRLTGTVAQGHFGGGGFGAGPKWMAWKPVGASVSWSDYSDFLTGKKLSHGGFGGKFARVTSGGAGIGIIGVDATYLTIHGVGGGAESLWLGGLASGTIGANVYSDYGAISIEVPSQRYENKSRVEWDRYEYTKKRDYGHVATFNTGSDQLTSIEVGYLRKWAEEFAADFGRP